MVQVAVSEQKVNIVISKKKKEDYSHKSFTNIYKKEYCLATQD
jgi:hypothetical protein